MSRGPGPPASSWAWIALGVNLGNRGLALACLRDSLGRAGAAVEGASGEILTRAVGVTNQGDFHNQVVLVRAPEPWTATRWLRVCGEVEAACGRRPTFHWGPRRADADIVLLGRHGEVVSAGAPTVPHPELARRPFWLRLIAEIDPAVAAPPGPAAAQMGSRSAS
ncbi:MAG: 2-amino-4-hydroxy-6-hydroxymethyldihydropteridine diphosphokinase [Candidatus Dormibacteria bacterium]